MGRGLQWIFTSRWKNGDTSAPPPLGNAILGGTPIGADVGYGPARFLTSREVQEVASALSGITADQLAGRFDLSAIVRARIYTYGMPPGGVLDEEDVDIDSEHDDIKSIFHELVEYYAEAARSGNGMLLYVR